MKTFLALYMGSAEPVDMSALSEEATAKGIAAWGQWMTDHADAVIDHGGPLGKTKKVSKAGVTDIRNLVGGYITVRAASHEAAAAMFQNHPHFTIFPGDSVEIMEKLPIPGAG